MKVRRILLLEPEIREELKLIAKKENRPLNNLIETILIAYLEQRSVKNAKEK